MSSRVSAGIMLYRRKEGRWEVFLAHPGGPLFATKDDGHWTIPKGEVDAGEDLLTTAQREFAEETGAALKPGVTFLPLGSIQQKGGKIVHAWAVEQEWMTRSQFAATSSRWNGRPAPGARKVSRRWIARSSFRWMKRAAS